MLIIIEIKTKLIVINNNYQFELVMSNKTVINTYCI